MGTTIKRKKQKALHQESTTLFLNEELEKQKFLSKRLEI